MNVDRRRHDLLVADGLLSPELTDSIAEAASGAMFEEQHLGSRLYRHRERAVVEDPSIAAGLWTPDANTRSVLTVLVYLPSSECVGGETRLDPDQLIEPMAWRIAVFDHAVLHEGSPVERGQKQVLRNDVIATWIGEP